jgi:histidinol-phosphate aminotransferase
MTEPCRDVVPEFIHKIQPYVPGKPVEEVEREMGIRAIKLASNENPLGPSPLAVQAAKKALADSNRYPDGGGYYLREALAQRLGVAMENLILGGGSTDLIELAAQMLLWPGLEGVTAQGTFPIYSIAIRASGAQLVEAPLCDYRYDLDAIAAALTPQSRVVYLSNPNNPTGTIFTATEFDAFLDRVPEKALVVLDEAYYEYVDRPDYSRSIDLVRQGRYLLVLRTFSKVYGLAGLRVGYGIGPAALLEEMNKIRAPFNTSGVAQAAALAALDDSKHVKRSLEANRAGLAQLARGLEEMCIRYIPSVANFVLVELGGDSEAVAQGLLKLGVIVRPMGWMGFPDGIRVTVGTAQENDKFLRALAKVRVPAGTGTGNKSSRTR